MQDAAHLAYAEGMEWGNSLRKARKLSAHARASIRLIRRWMTRSSPPWSLYVTRMSDDFSFKTGKDSVNVLNESRQLCVRAKRVKCWDARDSFLFRP
mmetsp:Transcript_1058/g.2269  ORF Transcript_1058/g.2269 Transcript_1058/m.2269 type:complete len:97 (+) Transcript_1058:843-1133(+)